MSGTAADTLPASGSSRSCPGSRRPPPSGAEWTLLYGGRTAASMAFTAELAAYGDRVTLCPQDRHGLLNLDRLLGTPRADTLVYACGPEPLLAAVEQRMTGWPAGAQHVLDGLRLAGVRGRLVLGL